MNWYKIAQIGEWWIIETVAHFADGDVGDANHSGVVIEAILSNYDMDHERFDLTKENEESLREKGLTEEEINVVFDKIDPRIYGMKNLGWKRVAGRNIQTQTLTEEDLKNIDYGLYDAYEQELEADNNIEFNIEVMGNRTYYTDVPYTIISTHNPLALREYQQGLYAKSVSWYLNYKTAKLLNIPDQFQKMFGLGEYKPKIKYHKCKKCSKEMAYWREDHPDTNMNEMAEYCKECGAL